MPAPPPSFSKLTLIGNILHWLEPLTIIQTLGLVGVWLVVFAESGLFIGFFFPGDSLLFTAGFLASQDLLNFWTLLGGSMVAAVVGDSVGYWFGRRVGPKIFTREKSRLFNPKHISRTHAFYSRYGKKTIILARFVPIVRTFAPILAGVGEMPYRTFLIYNIVGGVLWTLGFIGAGFTLGRVLPNTERYLSLIVLVIIIISVLPIAIEWWREGRQAKNPSTEPYSVKKLDNHT